MLGTWSKRVKSQKLYFKIAFTALLLSLYFFDIYLDIVESINAFTSISEIPVAILLLSLYAYNLKCGCIEIIYIQKYIPIHLRPHSWRSILFLYFLKYISYLYFVRNITYTALVFLYATHYIM